MARYDIAGLGNALVDALVRVEDDAALLAEFGIARGEMTPVDDAAWHRVYELVKPLGVEVQSGGSCANTIAALGLMGMNAIYRGQVGTDELGQLYEARITEACGQHALRHTDEHPTGKCLSIVGARDAERTLITDLGGAVLMPDLGPFPDIIRDSRLFHVTAYLLLDEPMRSRAREAIAVAREAGVPVSVDVADPFVVRSVRDLMWEILREDADIVFLNEEEARALGEDEPERALADLAGHCRTVVLKLGSRGSLVKHDGRLYPVSVRPVRAVDTTGAGDAFAAGFLYGWLHGWPADRSAALGSRVAALTVGQLGAVVRDREVLAEAIRAVGG